MLTWSREGVVHKDSHVMHSYREFMEIINGRPVARASQELYWKQTNSISVM